VTIHSSSRRAGWLAGGGFILSIANRGKNCDRIGESLSDFLSDLLQREDEDTIPHRARQNCNDLEFVGNNAGKIKRVLYSKRMHGRGRTFASGAFSGVFRPARARERARSLSLLHLVVARSVTDIDEPLSLLAMNQTREGVRLAASATLQTAKTLTKRSGRARRTRNRRANLTVA